MNRRLGLLTGTSRCPRLMAWAVGILTLAGISVGIGVGIAGRFRPEVELAAAEKALRQDDPAAARVPLDRCLAHSPNLPKALLLAATAARRCDACADAERFLTAFDETSGPTAASRLEWALLGAHQGDFAGEEDRLLAAVAGNHPDTAAILEALARGYAVSYRWPDAVGALSRLLDSSPGHVPALLLRGAILDRLRQTDVAEKDFRRAVERAPASAPAHAALAGVLNRQGHTREAIYHYELAQRFRPGEPATLLGLARALGDAAKLDEAQRQLDALLAAAPEHAEGLVERGRLALRRGRAAEAGSFLGRAVRAAPWHRDGQQLYLAALKELGRGEAAECEARVAGLRDEDALAGRLEMRARTTPSDAAVRWELWLWSQRNGQAEEGLAWLTEILRLDPRHAGAHAALADLFDRAGQPRRAALHRAAAGP
jgi:tetratricopeptide (TPR) repeat protein